MEKATRAQWIKCAIVILLYLAFLVWVKSWWGLIVVPFIFDIYITKKVPWSFWKKSKNSTVRNVMSWVDAIVFALVAVYFVNIYVFQNYQIPSSSLEKSLLVGDFLYVSKMSYGPRVPNTPLSMPLAQHTLPLVNTKSYIEWPQWKYKRVPGFGKVKMLDKSGEKGNYLESSCSTMFVYALFKAVRMGYIDQSYLDVALKGYKGILDNFIEVDNDGLVTITKACAVAGLGGKNYRSGDYDYYINETIRDNDPKAVGPFIMASLEYERIQKN